MRDITISVPTIKKLKALGYLDLQQDILNIQTILDAHINFSFDNHMQYDEHRDNLVYDALFNTFNITGHRPSL